MRPKGRPVATFGRKLVSLGLEIAAKIRVAADNSIRLASSRFPIAGMNRAMNSFEVSLIARAKEPVARARNAR